MRPLEPGSNHDVVHGLPAGHPAPGPKLERRVPVSLAGLLLVEAVHHVERHEQQSRGEGERERCGRRPSRRFLRLSKVSTPAARSTRSTVRASASDRSVGGIGQVSCTTCLTVRSARSASRRKTSRSPAVTYFRSPSTVCSRIHPRRQHRDGSGRAGSRAGATLAIVWKRRFRILAVSLGPIALAGAACSRTVQSR